MKHVLVLVGNDLLFLELRAKASYSAGFIRRIENGTSHECNARFVYPTELP